MSPAPNVSQPIRTSSAIHLLWLRPDLPREEASAYWAGPHGEIVASVLDGIEYVQHHFSRTDHGFWPHRDGLGTAIPEDWFPDGFPEVRFGDVRRTIGTALRMRPIMLDEQNAFMRVLGHFTGPGGGRWWSDGYDDSVAYRVALLVRRRRGCSGSAFRRFLHDRLGPALNEAGARDLRTYAFVPWNPLLHATPGVSHDNPAGRRYQGAAVLGGEDRAALERVFASAPVASLESELLAATTAVHAYGIERSVPVITPDG